MRAVREWARELKRQTLTLYYAVRDPRTPWHAKLVAALIVAYAISPIDLIPEFIPVLGYLDEIILPPAAIRLALKLVPAAVLEAARQKAEQTSVRPTSTGCCRRYRRDLGDTGYAVRLVGLSHRVQRLTRPRLPRTFLARSDPTMNARGARS